MIMRTLWRIGFLLLLLGTAACGSPASTEVWDEPFDETGPWQLSSDAAAVTRIEEGRLLIHVREPGQVAWAVPDKRFTNFRLSVEATLVGGPENNEYGVLARMDGDQNFYAFSISSDGYARVARYAEGQWQLLSKDWFPHAAIAQGVATNRLELEAQGATFSFRVNDELIVEVTDAALRKGDIGLYAGAFDEGDVQVAFDNLHVEPLP